MVLAITGSGDFDHRSAGTRHGSLALMACEILSRNEAISRLRNALSALVVPGKSICQVAAEKEIFCRGFAAYSELDLRRRFGFLADKATSRRELERRANLWQLERQEIDRAALSCDVQKRFHETCRGWDDFSDRDLAQFCFDLLHENVVVR